jgi:hypothetical protein
MSGKPGMRKRAPLGEVQARQRMWNSMRQLRRFSTGDLQATAEVGASHAQKYLRALAKHEYLRLAEARRSGVSGGHAVYAIVRDTGPHAPRIGKAGLLDPNLEPAKPLPGDEPVTMKRREYDHAVRCVRACAGMQDPEKEVAALRAAGGRA